MPPRGINDPKMKEMYEHVKESELEKNQSEDEAERIAAAARSIVFLDSGEMAMVEPPHPDRGADILFYLASPGTHIHLSFLLSKDSKISGQ